MKAEEAGSVGGWLSRRALVPDPVLGLMQPAALFLEAVWGEGALLRTVAAPRSACGPDLGSLFCGTRGAFGVLTSVAVKLEPIPERCVSQSFGCPSLVSALMVLRRCWQGPVVPAQVQLAAAVEGVWLRVSLEGNARLVEAAVRAATAAARDVGANSTAADAPAPGLEPPAGEAPALTWSALLELLDPLGAAVGTAAPAAAWVVEDVEPHGGRLRLTARAPAELHERLRRRRASGGAAGPAAQDARAWLERLRARLDPEGLLNPQAWPLPDPGVDA